jgi:hypothetical protein
VTLPYDAAAHRHLRIRHDAATGEVLWETAPSVGGGPGTWQPVGEVQLHSTGDASPKAALLLPQIR